MRNRGNFAKVRNLLRKCGRAGIRETVTTPSQSDGICVCRDTPKPSVQRRPSARPTLASTPILKKITRNAAIRSSRRPRCSPLLKALPAINRAPLSRLEGHRSFFATLRADRTGFHTPVSLPVQQLRSFGLAGLTAFWFVFKPLVSKKELFASRENEFRSAVDALEDPIPVFHD